MTCAEVDTQEKGKNDDVNFTDCAQFFEVHNDKNWANFKLHTLASNPLRFHIMLPAPLFLMPRAPPGLWIGLFTGILKG